MADSATFLVSYPEFSDTNPDLVTAKMEEAVRQLDPTVFGATLDDATYLLTAQKLAKMPMGNAALIDATTGRTVYDEELLRLRREATSGIRNT